MSFRIFRRVSGSSFGFQGPTALSSSPSTRTRSVVSGWVSAAGALVSGRGALPAAGIFRLEKSGVSPGRNGGSGTCSARLGALRRRGGALSAIVVARALTRVRGRRQLGTSRMLDIIHLTYHDRFPI